MPGKSRLRKIPLSQWRRKPLSGTEMPIYALDDATPELPAEGDYWVAPNAVLIGKVRLLKGASVWWGCVLRGDNDWITVGEGSNVQDNSVIHTDPGQPVTIGANCTVGHRVILHSTTVEDGSLIGMGSTLLNRSRIGKNCLVGANSLVTEGKQFEDGSMILGVPARVARKLTDTELAGLKYSAAGYVHNHQRFASKMREVR
jgi:carbonic anhydrase/acetyltransferase-like protein (isoleucine patch superfamily)